MYSRNLRKPLAIQGNLRGAKITPSSGRGLSMPTEKKELMGRCGEWKEELANWFSLTCRPIFHANLHAYQPDISPYYAYQLPTWWHIHSPHATFLKSIKNIVKGETQKLPMINNKLMMVSFPVHVIPWISTVFAVGWGLFLSFKIIKRKGPWKKVMC